ncbi:hypothetical protein IJM86_03440 [bacterium]|nr:hypothetical protein [bacterium]
MNAYEEQVEAYRKAQEQKEKNENLRIRQQQQEERRQEIRKAITEWNKTLMDMDFDTALQVERRIVAKVKWFEQNQRTVPPFLKQQLFDVRKKINPRFIRLG